MEEDDKALIDSETKDSLSRDLVKEEILSDDELLSKVETELIESLEDNISSVESITEVENKLDIKNAVVKEELDLTHGNLTRNSGSNEVVEETDTFSLSSNDSEMNNADDKHKLLSAYVCCVCDYSNRELDVVEVHMREHTRDKSFAYKLLYNNFNNLNDQNSHLINKDDGLYECLLCSYRTAVSSSLNIHMMSHDPQRTYECQECNYKTNWVGYLQRHMKSHVENEKTFECKQCGYTTFKQSYLTKHMKLHTAEKIFTCNICPYKTSQLFNLRVHIKSHTGEKPFFCDMCDFKTAYPSSLKKHKSVHKGEKSFFCSQCPFSTAYSSNLKMHLRTHRGEKPIACKLCRYRTVKSSNLVLHMKRSHTDK